MVKRTLHIGTFLQGQPVSEVSLAGIFPMCGRSSTHLQKFFFLKSIAGIIENWTIETSADDEGDAEEDDLNNDDLEEVDDEGSELDR
jgi:hypothetical protein